MKRRNFTREFKVEAVELIQERGVTEKMGSRLVIIHFDTRRRIVSTLSNCNRLCSEEGPAAWNGGLAAFARPSSQGVARGRAEILSCCS